MLRRLLTFASVLSLVLGVGTCALWAWSYTGRAYYWVEWPRGPGADHTETGLGAGWQQGIATVSRTTTWDWPGTAPPTDWQAGSTSGEPIPSFLQADAWLGFGCYTSTRGQWGSYDPDRKASRRTHVVQFPFWSAALASAVVPAFWVRAALGRRRRRTRARLGLCPSCGYDLRTAPDPGGSLLDRCPECGAVSGAEIASYYAPRPQSERPAA